MATNEDVSQYIQSHFAMSTKQIYYMKCLLNFQTNSTSNDIDYYKKIYAKFKTAPIHEIYLTQQYFPISKYKRTLNLLANHLRHPTDIQSLLYEKRKNEEEKECHECIKLVRRRMYSTRQWNRKVNRRCKSCCEKS